MVEAGSSGLQRTARAFLTDAAVVVGVAGALVYGLVALGYDRFYRTLGISPGDVGVDQQRIIAHAAIALAVFATALVGMVALTHAVLSWFLRPGFTWWVSVAVVAVLGPVGLGLTSAPVLFARPFVFTTLGVAGAVLVAAVGSILVQRRADTAVRKRAVTLLWVAVLALSYGASVQFATVRMAKIAHQVVAGTPIPPDGLTFTFDVHADPVCIREGGTVVYGLYLGEKDDWMAYFKPSEGRTIRRARGEAELSFLPPGPVPARPCS